MLENLKKSLINAPIVKRGEYHYFIHPISDGIPSIEPILLEEITDHIQNKANIDVDKILTIESMGIPIATALSLKTGIPFTIIRKREYKLKNEVVLSQSTGYSKDTLYINGINKGDRILIVDDVLSTGGTLVPLIKALKSIGAIIVDVVVVIGREKNLSKLNEMGVNVKTLIDITVTENGVVIKE
ncbi:MAG: purine phosphoribosyltransferase family protein [Methanosarcinaceae archaeon]|jgi:adenine phosphoribosyltransferase|nr:purine phosphoribosyltransferase family protein [Methanosarcinaceae archaeon]NKQ38251.1 purine phosphoribosyltransferase family protein [Methanosarcinales archaeon]